MAKLMRLIHFRCCCVFYMENNKWSNGKTSSFIKWNYRMYRGVALWETSGAVFRLVIILFASIGVWLVVAYIQRLLASVFNFILDEHAWLLDRFNKSFVKSSLCAQAKAFPHQNCLKVSKATFPPHCKWLTRVFINIPAYYFPIFFFFFLATCYL